MAVRIGAFGLLSAAEQERRLERWGRILASLAVEGGTVRRLQTLERHCPARTTSSSAISLSRPHLHIGARRPATAVVRAPRRLRGEHTQDHELLVALQVDQRRAWALAARDSPTARLDRDQQATAILAREIQALVGRFELSELRVAGVLRRRNALTTIARAFDPFSDSRRRRDRRTDGRRGGVGSLPGGASAGTALTGSRSGRGSASAPAFFAPLLLDRRRGPLGLGRDRAGAARRARAAPSRPPSRATRPTSSCARERGFRTSARRRKQQEATRRREQRAGRGPRGDPVRRLRHRERARRGGARRAGCEEVEQRRAAGLPRPRAALGPAGLRLRLRRAAARPRTRAAGPLGLGDDRATAPSAPGHRATTATPRPSIRSSPRPAWARRGVHRPRPLRRLVRLRPVRRSTSGGSARTRTCS